MADSAAKIALSNIATSSLSANAATVTWTSNVGGSSQVLYGTSSSYGQSTTLNSTMLTSHSVGLSSLTASTLYHYQAASVDASGNVAKSGDLTFTTPAAGSTPPTVSLTAPSAGAAVSGSAVTVSASASASAGLTLASVQFLLDGSNLGSPILAAPWTTTWNTTGVSNGTHSLTALATDSGGNKTTSAPVSVTVNNAVPPTISITSPVSGATVLGTVTVTTTVSTNTTSVQFKVDGNNTGAAVTSAPFSYSLNTATLSNATHSITAVASNAAAQTTTSAAVSVTVNNSVSPTISITSPASGATVSGTVTVTTTVSANTTSVQFKVDGNNTGAAVTSAPFGYSLNTTTLSNATHSITAVASNAAAQTTTSAAVSVTVNNAAPTPPTISITAPASGATVSGTVTITTSVSANATSVQFKVDGSNTGAALTSAPFSYSLNTTTLSNATHSITAVASNAAAQTTTSAAVSVTVNNAAPTPPTISITAPASGTTVSGIVTVTTSVSANTTSVQFKVDGNNTGAAVISAPFSYSLNTTTLSNATHSITAVASNAAAQTTTSAAVSITVSNAATPPGLGWTKISYSELKGSENTSPCPPDGLNGYTPVPDGYVSFCNAVMLAWSSAVFDQGRNRMILWGGGHGDYGGNEIYGLEVGQVGTCTSSLPCIVRYDPPSPPNTAEGTNVETLAACTVSSGCLPTTPAPNSRHTYDGLVYDAAQDAMYAFGAALNSNGGASNDIWKLALSSVTASCAPNCNPVWTLAASNTDIGTYGNATDLDPNTGLIWIMNQNNMGYFNPTTNTYTHATGTSNGYESTGIIDPVHDYFLYLGGQGSGGGNPTGITWVSIASGSSYTQNQPTLPTSCGVSNWGSYPGVAWDPVDNVAVIYPDGGNTIYLLNPASWTCTSESYGSTQGVDYPQNSNVSGPTGDNFTFKHFSYSAQNDAFELCNDSASDCWYLNRRASNPVPPTISIIAPASGATVSGILAVTTSVSVNTTSVQFQVDGSNAGAAVTSAPFSYSLNTAALSNASHSITAVASNAAAQTTTSAAVSITVNNAAPTPPTISITAPASGATVSGTVAVATSVSANTTSVQFQVDGNNTGAAVTSAPFSYSLDTTMLSNASHSITATASNAAAQTTTSAAVSVTVSNTVMPPPPNASDTITISDKSGTTQTNRPVSIARPFEQGEIVDFAEAFIGGQGLLTQCDVKNRWPDGSLKFAIVSFVIPSLPANGSVTVTFANQTSGNNTGYLAKADMLTTAYNFDGQIQLNGTASHTISARTALNAAPSCSDPGNDPDGGQYVCSYWLKGPIVTAVILEDRAGRSLDVNTDGGTGNPLHPIFEAWFYPQGNSVQLGYTLEDSWASTNPNNSARDQTYSLTLTGGNTNPVTEFTNTTFTQITRSRWHKSFWVVNQPGQIAVDNNWPYLSETKFVPHWDTTLTIAPSLIASNTNSDRFSDALQGQSTGIANYDAALDSGGADPVHGPLTTWDIIGLMSQDPGVQATMLRNADLGGRLPYFFREADAMAGHGQYFDAPTDSIATQGRVVSINARTQTTLYDVTTNGSQAQCNTNYAADWINFGGSGQDLDIWAGSQDTTHWPNLAYASYLMTGQYAYYEEQLMQSAYAEADNPGSRACDTPTQGSSRVGADGYWYIDQERGTNWMAREVAIGAFIAVDGSPEKAYFLDKLNTNLAAWEGTHNITLDVTGCVTAVTCNQAWTFGNTYRAAYDTAAGTTLGSWTEGLTAYAPDGPLNQTGANVPNSADAWFQAAYGGLVIGWINDLGYCPTSSGSCAILNYVANHYINQVLNPNGNMYALYDYVYPTLDQNGNQITSWAENKTFYATNSSSWPSCSSNTIDEGYGQEGMAALSYMTTITSSQGGYSGQTAYNNVRNTIGCINNSPGSDFASSSPKWDITPR